MTLHTWLAGLSFDQRTAVSLLAAIGMLFLVAVLVWHFTEGNGHD